MRQTEDISRSPQLTQQRQNVLFQDRRVQRSHDALADVAGTIQRVERRPLSQVRKGYTHFADGDVIFAKITPCMENGKVALVPPLANHVGFGSTEFHVLRSSGAVEPKWIAYYVSQLEFRKAARQDMSGSAGQLRVQSGWLASATLPVAPLAEQSRILLCLEELITELDAGVLKLQRQGKAGRASEIATLVKAIVTDFSDRVLPLDLEAARIMAQLSETTQRNTVGLPDIMIAATAKRHGLAVLTRNLRDFNRIGIAARDPLTDLPPDI